MNSPAFIFLENEITTYENPSGPPKVKLTPRWVALIAMPCEFAVSYAVLTLLFTAGVFDWRTHLRNVNVQLAVKAEYS